ALMVGTAGLPHVIVRFYTVRSVRAARWSTGWALLFIALLYTTAPSIAAFAKYYILDTLTGRTFTEVQAVPWVQGWIETGLITLQDSNGDGVVQAVELFGQDDPPVPAAIDPDIIVLATPEIARLAPWLIALVAAGGLAAALSSPSGLLIVISSAIAHDIYGNLLRPEATDERRLAVGRATT